MVGLNRPRSHRSLVLEAAERCLRPRSRQRSSGDWQQMGPAAWQRAQGWRRSFPRLSFGPAEAGRAGSGGVARLFRRRRPPFQKGMDEQHGRSTDQERVGDVEVRPRPLTRPIPEENPVAHATAPFRRHSRFVPEPQSVIQIADNTGHHAGQCEREPAVSSRSPEKEPEDDSDRSGDRKHGKPSPPTGTGAKEGAGVDRGFNSHIRLDQPPLRPHRTMRRWISTPLEHPVFGQKVRCRSADRNEKKKNSSCGQIGWWTKLVSGAGFSRHT